MSKLQNEEPHDEPMSGSEDVESPPSNTAAVAVPPATSPPDVGPPPNYQSTTSQWPKPTPPQQQQQQQQQQPVYYPPQQYPVGHVPVGSVPVQQQPSNNVVVVQQPGYTYGTAPVRPNDYLDLSIFACLCCCWPIAIVALVHSCQVNDRYNAGDYAGAVDASQKARYWSKVSIVVGSVLSVVLVVFVILQTAAVVAATSSV